MMVFKENKKTGLQCGINDYGELFFGDDRSGYNLTDTPENREHILVDFDYYNGNRTDDKQLLKGWVYQFYFITKKEKRMQKAKENCNE